MNADHEKDQALVQKALDGLGEHFDSVQIFANRSEPTEGGTIHVSLGTGNWFARYGQCREWLIKEEQSSRNKVPKEEP